MCVFGFISTVIGLVVVMLLFSQIVLPSFLISVVCLSFCLYYPQWAVKGPVSPLDGAKEGVLNLLHEITGGISDFIRLPFRGAQKNNAVGAMKGLSMGVINLAQRPIRGGILLVDKCVTGIINFVRTQSKQIKHASPLAQTEIEMVEGPIARRYTVYPSIRNWELAMKKCLFGNYTTIHCFANF